MAGKLLLCLLLAGCLFILGVLGMLIIRTNRETRVDWRQEPYEAIVVLGAQVRQDGSLSLQLTWRLDAALEAWRHRQVPIVVCGAQGSNEPCTEARAMRDYLVSKGVPEEQIRMDEASFNTRENLANAAALLPEAPQLIMVVTSDYHLPRALALARDLGWNAIGQGGRTLPEYWVKNYSRETLAWVKYWLQKYLGF